jgi:hypothetical protein
MRGTKKPGQQALAGAGFGLDPRQVGDARGRAALGRVAHAFDDEGVVSIARVGVAGAQGLEHDERQVQFRGASNRVLQGVVVVRAPVGSHPVQHMARTLVLAAAGRVDEDAQARRGCGVVRGHAS